MATVTTTRLIDDLDDEQEADETIDFGLDGRRYEIDLSSENAGQLREVLRPFLDAARKAGASSGGRKPQESSGRGRSVADKDRAAAIRAWVREHGGTISDRGRIPVDLIAAYDRKDASVFAKVDEDDEDDARPEVDETDELDDELDDEFDEADEDSVEDDEPEGAGEKVAAGSGVGDPFSSTER